MELDNLVHFEFEGAFVEDLSALADQEDDLDQRDSLVFLVAEEVRQELVLESHV